MKTFEEMLAIEGSAAQETLIHAMLEWWMASDREDALEQIRKNPGVDLAGIKNSVMAGLTSLAESRGVSLESLICENLGALANASPSEIIKALNCIHIQWITDNFSAKRWAEKFFKGQLYQYRKTGKLPWKELLSDLLFNRKYLKKGGNQYSDDELREAFEKYAEANAADDDLEAIAEKARTFAPEIKKWIVAYRDKLDPVKKAGQIADINEFLSKHNDGAEIMEIMIQACCE